MEKNNLYLIVIGIIICIVLGCLSPFIASADPDGLEKSAEDVNASALDVGVDSGEVAPFPDYTFEPAGIAGEIGVLILGAIIALIVGLGVGEILKKRNS